jgi:hypothetical protein
MKYILSHLWYLSLTTVIVCAAIAAVIGTAWLLTLWLRSCRCTDLFRTFAALLIFPGVLLLCLAGTFAALVGWRTLDVWCERQLLDTDGQKET